MREPLENTAYMVVNPGMGWLENALPEAALLSKQQVLIFVSSGAIVQFFNQATRCPESISALIYPSGIPIPKIIRIGIEVCCWLVKLKSLPSSWLGLRIAGVLYRLGEFRWAEKVELKTGLLFADFHTVDLARLGYFSQLPKLHVAHGFHCRLEENLFFYRNLKSVDTYITWNVFQAEFYETQGMSCVRKQFAKLRKPVFLGRLSEISYAACSDIVLYLGRPITEEYISTDRFERIFRELIEAVIQINGHLVVKPHPKEVYSKVYSDILATTELKKWSLVDNPIMSFADRDIKFAFSLYTGTCVETLAMGVPNGQLLGLHNSKLGSPIDVFEYIDAGLTLDCSGFGSQDFVKLIGAREKCLEFQLRSFEDIVFD